METVNYFGIAAGSPNSLMYLGLLMGSLFVVFAAGFLAGSRADDRRRARRGEQADAGIPPAENLQISDPFLMMGSNFPGALVQIEKIAGEWICTVLSKGAEMTGPDWDVLGPSGIPVSLPQLLDGTEAGFLSDVLETAATLDIPVNYECKLKSDTAGGCPVALMLSVDKTASRPLLRGIAISNAERKLLEQELCEEKHFAEQVMEYSGVLFSVRNKEMKLIRTNKAFLEISGYSPEEMYFSDGDQHLLGEEYHPVLDQFSRVLAGEYPLVSENPWHCKDGSRRFVRWTNTGLRNSEGEVHCIISVGVDITDLRQLEKQLEDRIDSFEALFENSLVGMALIKDRKIVQANRVCAEVLGYCPAEINGLDLSCLFDDDTAFQQFLKDVVPRVVGGLRHFDHPFRMKNGHHGDFRLSISPITAGVLEDGIIIVLDDISEIKLVERALQHSERRFRTIFDKMASGLALSNTAGVFGEVNDSWCRITGYSREEGRQLRIMDITHPDDVKRSEEVIVSLTDNGLDMERMEKRYIRKDGSTLWVDLTASVIHTEAGDSTFVSIINDITERKKIEKELIDMNLRLKQEKTRAEILADHRMAVIELFDTFRNSQSVEDLHGILKNNLPRFVKYRDIMLALRISRTNPGYVIRDLMDETPESDILALLREGRGIIGSVIQSRQIYLSNDVRTDPVFHPHHPEVRSYLSIPIVYKDFLWGVIGLDHFEAGHFTEQDIEILTIVGTLIAMQMEEMTAKAALHLESDRLRVLHDIVQEMAQARSDEDIRRIISSSDLFSEIHIYPPGASGKLEACICSVCEGQPALMPMQSHELNLASHVVWETDDRHHMALPIRYNMEVMGLLRICSELPFANHEIELASILAEQTGVFWELNKLIAQREREAMIDPLTAVWNRRYMIDRLEQEDRRMLLHGGKGCVAILDMGDFKLINDLYGHVKGDEVLTAVAEKVGSAVRKTDHVGRYGGDEFIIFFPETDIVEAEQLIAAIAAGVSSLLIAGVNRQIEIDCGVAMVPGDDVSLIEAVRTADERMYFNKRERKRRTLIVD